MSRRSPSRRSSRYDSGDEDDDRYRRHSSSRHRDERERSRSSRRSRTPERERESRSKDRSHRDERSSSRSSSTHTKHSEDKDHEPRREEDKSSSSSHKRKSEQVPDGEAEAKKARLEAWKKKVEENNLMKKLKEEKDKLEQERQKAQLAAATNNNTNETNTKPISMVVASNLKNESKPQLNTLSEDDQTPKIIDDNPYNFDVDDDDDDDQPIQQHPQPIKQEDQMQQEEEEVDPLDEYMNEVNSQVKKLIPNNKFNDDIELIHKKPTNVITYDDILTKQEPIDSIVPDVTSEEDDSAGFMEALRKRANEVPTSTTVIMTAEQQGLQRELEQDLNRDDVIDMFGDDQPVANGPAIDDYLYPQTLEGDQQASILERQSRLNKKDLKPVDHSKINYPTFRKNFFILPKEFRNLDEAQIKDLRTDMGNIRVRFKEGDQPPPPIRSWSQCGLNDTILDDIKKLGYEEPFAIQKQAIPCIMSGRDEAAKH
ncbi:pre-mRNA-processing ATP-dependent RNA helicase [Acrasis kona]|uniref:Pre-mRNA-processing ATP-dependent RNA helicase n=1 Tax=Acrasis kona TaxID=1008807 RepID=A0AAW2YSV7_9EUKA